MDNARTQIVVHDVLSGSNLLVSASYEGADGGDGDSRSPQISPDGRWVVFQSQAANLVPNDHNGLTDVFARDLTTGTTYCLSLNAEGTGPANSYSGNPVLSADGRSVLFTSFASDMVAGDFNQAADVFLAQLPVVAEMRILTIELSPGGLRTLRWTAVAGATYRIQFKNSLADPAWIDLAGEVTAVSDTAEKSDSTDTAVPARFYRVVQVQ
jgi:hypothetical protein